MIRTSATHEQHTYWIKWAESLRRWGLNNIVAWLLEAAGPMTAVGAQALYIGQPFLYPELSGRQIKELAQLLENSDEVHQFVIFLRDDNHREAERS